jgi:hypothetical protein
LKPYLPKKEFDELLTVCDVGLIYLDNRFTIPNYPSRILSYMQASLPILMSSDMNTDLGKQIVDWKIGLWNYSGDIESFIRNYCYLLDLENRNKFKVNIPSVLKSEFNVQVTYQKIMNHMKKGV